jgi:uncharacterized membrane protein YcaP (DUF421 family)
MDSKTLHDMFFLGVPVIEKVLRPIAVYVFLVSGLRLAGKRELAQLNPFDLVVLLMLSNAVQNAIIGEDNTVIGGIIGATTLLAVNHVVVRFVSRHQKAERIFEGEPTVLIEKGVLKRTHLADELLSQSELRSAANKQGFRSLDEVERAVLEPGGNITFEPKKPMAEDKRHAELMARLDQVLARLEQ